jgi:hypothetical protein
VIITHIDTEISNIFIGSGHIFKPKYEGRYRVKVYSSDDELTISSVTVTQLYSDADLYQCDIDDISDLLNTYSHSVDLSQTNEQPKLHLFGSDAIDDSYIIALKEELTGGAHGWGVPGGASQACAPHPRLA